MGLIESAELYLKEIAGLPPNDRQKESWQQACRAMDMWGGVALMNKLVFQKGLGGDKTTVLEQSLPNENPYWFCLTLKWEQLSNVNFPDHRENIFYRGVKVYASYKCQTRVFFTSGEGWVSFEHYNGGDRNIWESITKSLRRDTSLEHKVEVAMSLARWDQGDKHIDPHRTESKI